MASEKMRRAMMIVTRLKEIEIEKQQLEAEFESLVDARPPLVVMHAAPKESAPKKVKKAAKPKKGAKKRVIKRVNIEMDQSTLEKKALHALSESPVLTTNAMKGRIGVSFYTAKRIMELLAEKKLVRSFSGKVKNKIGIDMVIEGGWALPKSADKVAQA